MANVHQLFVGVVAVMVVVLSLLSVPSATTAFDSFNNSSSPSHSHVDSDLAEQENGITSSRTPGQTYQKFDYVRLVMQWTPTHCKDRRPKCAANPIPRFFIIHGFRPDNLNGQFLISCYNVPYVPITDRTLLSSMTRVWPNVESGDKSNAALWKDRWEKHGTCSLFQYKDQTGYFKQAVELHSKYDVIGEIRKSMVPRSDETYERTDLINVIKKITSKDPSLGCLKSGRIESLHEVHFCFTPQGAVRDCPQNRIPSGSSACTASKIVFPEAYDKFDYLRLAMTWAPTHCKDLNPPCRVSPPTDFFIIHGLWPDNLKGNFLANCYKVPYVPITDASLLSSMTRFWPNVVSGSAQNAGIWRHQWEKHGTCALTKYKDQTDYFKKAVELYSQYDVIGAIRKNMRPTTNEMYQRSRLIQVVKQITTKTPGLSCLTDRSGKIQSLHEIHFCFDPEDHKVTDCLADRIPRASRCTNTQLHFPQGIPQPSPPPPRPMA